MKNGFEKNQAESIVHACRVLLQAEVVSTTDINKLESKFSVSLEQTRSEIAQVKTEIVWLKWMLRIVWALFVKVAVFG